MLMLLRIQFMILIKEEVVADEVKEILLPCVTFEPRLEIKARPKQAWASEKKLMNCAKTKANGARNINQFLPN